jgi:hypothetical protein
MESLAIHALPRQPLTNKQNVAFDTRRSEAQWEAERCLELPGQWSWTLSFRDEKGKHNPAGRCHCVLNSVLTHNGHSSALATQRGNSELRAMEQWL